jgi:hypothetical protein
MALDASELYVAGTGNIYTAPEDTPMPDAASLPPTTPWDEHGYTTEDGVTFTFGKTTDELKGWQSFDTLRLITTEAPKSVKFALMQSNVINLTLALGGGTVDSVTGIFTPADASVLDMRALYISANDGGEVWTLWAPRVLLSDNVELMWKKSDAASTELTFSIQATSDGSPPYLMKFPDEWTTGLGTQQDARSEAFA